MMCLLSILQTLRKHNRCGQGRYLFFLYSQILLILVHDFCSTFKLLYVAEKLLLTVACKVTCQNLGALKILSVVSQLTHQILPFTRAKKISTHTPQWSPTSPTHGPTADKFEYCQKIPFFDTFFQKGKVILCRMMRS